MPLNQLPIICLMGPTAVGKSQLAIYLAEKFPCDIVSVDSVMVYKGMNIGTAKPDSNTLHYFPHALINIREPTNPYSAGDFFREVTELIEKSLNKNRIPLLVGGTMMYFNILKKGLFNSPNINSDANYPELKKKLNDLDAHKLYSQLQKYDPKTASRLHINDRQRIQRALLVYYLSKKPLNELHQLKQKKLAYKMSWIGIYPETREKLKATIAARFNQMLAQGFIEEAKSLYPKLVDMPQLPAYRAVGYRQIWDYLKGNIDFDTFKQHSITATCHLAKHQLTWLRCWEELTTFNISDVNLLQKITLYVKEQITN